MGSPAASSPPPVLAPGAKASLTTPMKVAKKAALATVNETQHTQEDDPIPAGQLSPEYTPLKQKELFQVTCLHKGLEGFRDISYRMIASIP